MANEPANVPVGVLRDGAIKATIWKNSGENGDYLTTTFARTYSKEGQPQDTGGFTHRDLLVVSEIARRAHHRCNALRADMRPSADMDREHEGRSP